MSEHSRFPPSAAAAWLECSGWLHFNATMPDTSSPAGDRGTRLHQEAAIRLTTGVRSKLDADDEISVGAYVAYVESLVEELEDARLLVETRVHFNEDVWGTADTIIVSRNRLDVIDYKSGSNRVHARNNSQLALYASAALRAPGLFAEHGMPLDVVLHIVQPAIDFYSAWEITPERLDAFRLNVEVAVDRAKAAPEYKPSETACRWCRGKQVCRARAEFNTNVVAQDFAQLNNAEVARIVPQLGQIRRWADDVEARAMELARAEQLQGYQIRMKPGARYWTDPAKVIEALVAAGVDPAIAAKSTPIGIGAAEKLLGKTHELFTAHCSLRESTESLVRVEAESSPALGVALSTNVKGDKNG